jgi:hypothetical protein
VWSGSVDTSLTRQRDIHFGGHKPDFEAAAHLPGGQSESAIARRGCVRAAIEIELKPNGPREVSAIRCRDLVRNK